MNRPLGNSIEQQALEHLQKQGLSLVARNYQWRRGEIDLIMRDTGVLIFVEVRYRKSSRFGNAAESVDQRKQQRLIITAQHFLQANPSVQNLPCRFDVIACSPDPNSADSRLQIDWIIDAFIC